MIKKSSQLVLVLLLHTTVWSVAQNVGINEDGSLPHNSALLHLKIAAPEKGFLVTGDTSSVAVFPSLGQGARMMFYPASAAFRVGYVADNQWNNAEVGKFSIGMGTNSRASGVNAVAIGSNTRAMGFNSIAMGCFNKMSVDNPTTWNETAPLLVVGNGTSEQNRQNALTILKNGNVGIGIDSAHTRLHVRTPNAVAARFESANATTVEINNNSDADRTSLVVNNAGSASAGYFNSENGIGLIAQTGNATQTGLYAVNTGGGAAARFSSVNGAGLLVDDGNVGIGNAMPMFPLSFANQTGNKICLWANPNNLNDKIGMGINNQKGLLLYNAIGGYMAFGLGSTGAFVEAARLDSVGHLGIGTAQPQAVLHLKNNTPNGNALEIEGGGIRISGNSSMNKSAFVLVADANNLVQADPEGGFSRILIDNIYANNKPEAMLFVTSNHTTKNYNVVYENGYWYMETVGFYIQNIDENGNPIFAKTKFYPNDKFNLLIIQQ